MQEIKGEILTCYHPKDKRFERAEYAGWRLASHGTTGNNLLKIVALMTEISSRNTQMDGRITCIDV